MRNFAIIVTAFLCVAAPIAGGAMGLYWSYWHYQIIEPHRTRGVETLATIVSTEKVGLKRTRWQAVVEFTPSGSSARSRAVIESPALQLRLHHPGKGCWRPWCREQYGGRNAPLNRIGDKVRIVFLPAEPNTEAILYEDFAEHDRKLPWLVLTILALLALCPAFFPLLKWLNRQEELAAGA